MVRATRIERAFLVWKTSVLPLDDASNLAGALRFELRNPVLETSGLAVEPTPLFKLSKNDRYILWCDRRDSNPLLTASQAAGSPIHHRPHHKT
jgi:hypothetical protein